MTYQDTNDELRYCATAIRERDPSICRDPAQFDCVMSEYLDLQSIGARRRSFGAQAIAFQAAANMLRDGSRDKACTVLLETARELDEATMTRLAIGTRIKMHAATSEWKQGDRYGTVVGYGRKRMYASHDRGRVNIDLVAPLRVMLDKSGRTVHVHPENVFVVD